MGINCAANPCKKTADNKSQKLRIGNVNPHRFRSGFIFTHRKNGTSGRRMNYIAHNDDHHDQENKSPEPVGQLRNANHPATTLHFREGQNGIRIDQ